MEEGDEEEVPSLYKKWRSPVWAVLFMLLVGTTTLTILYWDDSNNPLVVVAGDDSTKTEAGEMEKAVPDLNPMNEVMSHPKINFIKELSSTTPGDIERRPRKEGPIRQAFVTVDPELVGHPVVGDIDIGAAVEIEVTDRQSETGAKRPLQTHRLRDLDERAIPLVPVERVYRRGLVVRRTAVVAKGGLVGNIATMGNLSGKDVFLVEQQQDVLFLPHGCCEHFSKQSKRGIQSIS